MTPELLPWLLAAIFGIDKLIAAFKRLRRIPRELRGEVQNYAEGLVTERVAQERSALLNSKADQILALLRPNGGVSVWDTIARVEDKLDSHIAMTAPLIDEHHAVKRALDAHLTLHLDGPQVP